MIEVELEFDETLFPPPRDPEAETEYAFFSNQEKMYFKGIWLVLVEEGTEPRRAERDAAAAILQHRRLHNSMVMSVEEINARWALALKYKEKGYSLEEAERIAFQRKRTPVVSL